MQQSSWLCSSELSVPTIQSAALLICFRSSLTALTSLSAHSRPPQAQWINTLPTARRGLTLITSSRLQRSSQLMTSRARLFLTAKATSTLKLPMLTAMLPAEPPLTPTPRKSISSTRTTSLSRFISLTRTERRFPSIRPTEQAPLFLTKTERRLKKRTKTATSFMKLKKASLRWTMKSFSRMPTTSVLKPIRMFSPSSAIFSPRLLRFSEFSSQRMTS